MLHHSMTPKVAPKLYYSKIFFCMLFNICNFNWLPIYVFTFIFSLLKEALPSAESSVEHLQSISPGWVCRARPSSCVTRLVMFGLLVQLVWLRALIRALSPGVRAGAGGGRAAALEKQQTQNRQPWTVPRPRGRQLRHLSTCPRPPNVAAPPTSSVPQLTCSVLWDRRLSGTSRWTGGFCQGCLVLIARLLTSGSVWLSSAGGRGMHRLDLGWLQRTRTTVHHKIQDSQDLIQQ